MLLVGGVKLKQPLQTNLEDGQLIDLALKYHSPFTKATTFQFARKTKDSVWKAKIGCYIFPLKYVPFSLYPLTLICSSRENETICYTSSTCINVRKLKQLRTSWDSLSIFLLHCTYCLNPFIVHYKTAYYINTHAIIFLSHFKWFISIFNSTRSLTEHP